MLNYRLVLFSILIRMIKSRMMKRAEHVARLWENMNAYRILVGNPEGKRPLGRPRRRWVDNIKTDTDQWRALVNVVMNLRFP
jgi:hypothetical protein